jgi:hypothetical protein
MPRCDTETTPESKPQPLDAMLQAGMLDPAIAVMFPLFLSIQCSDSCARLKGQASAFASCPTFPPGTGSNPLENSLLGATNVECRQELAQRSGRGRGV